MDSIQQSKSLEYKGFSDLKQNAYRIALVWKNKGCSKEWLKKYLDQFSPSTNMSLYKQMIELYSEFLNENITREDAEKQMNEYEKKFNQELDFIHRIFLFNAAKNKAFKQAKIEYGEVTFECPLCNGEAYGVRLYTPGNVSHKVTFRCGCKDCGYSAMN